jgi:8-oxo-dGTP pyrophosphatase MutT (NUDIX family)
MPALPEAVRQAAVIPLRAGRVCLVLSSGGKRWVVPKGHIERGQSAGETALQEAWEEAGLVGALRREPVGSYLYRKANTTCHVVVFLMDVTEAAPDWPEGKRRLRRWVSRSRALARVRIPGLRRLLRQVLAVEPVHERTQAARLKMGPSPGRPGR